MRHDVSVEGVRLRLRPVRRSDAAFIVALRSDPALSRYLHPVSPRVEDQETWLDAYFERDGDYYFVVEGRASGDPEGTIGIYDVAGGTAEWGRWVLARGSLAAPESVLLLYRAAFESLGLDSVCCRTVADNARVVSFHTSAGLETVRRIPAAFELRGSPVDAIEQRLTRAAWPATRAVLEARVRQLEELLSR